MEEQIAKYFSGNLSKKEEEKLREWRSESEQNSSYFFEYEQVWKASSTQETDMNATLNAIFEKIDEKEIIDDHTNNTVKLPWLKYAAAIAVVSIGLLFIGKSILSETEDLVAMQVVESKGNLEIITLPDGSVVTLSENSTLTYDLVFKGATRVVKLEGKAFFDVRRDVTRPFIVNTSQSKIEVLGTSFLVNTLGLNKSTEVVVKTGRVAVSKRAIAEKKIELVAGEVGTLSASKEEFIKTSLENYNYLAWKTKLITFEKDNIQTVINTLEEVYSVKIKTSTDELLNCEVTAKFDNQPIEAVLEILSITFNIGLEKTGEKKFLLKGKGC